MNKTLFLIPLLALILSPMAQAKTVDGEAINAAVAALQAGDTPKASREGKKAYRACKGDRRCQYLTHLSLTKGYADIAKWSAAIFRGRKTVEAAKRLDKPEDITVAYAYYAIALAGGDKDREALQAINDGLEWADKVDKQLNGERVPIELLMAGAQALLQHKQENYDEAVVFQERFIRGHKKLWPGSLDVVKEMLLLSSMYGYTNDVAANHQLLQGAKLTLENKGDSPFVKNLQAAVEGARHGLVNQRAKLYLEGCLPVMQAYDQALLVSARQMLIPNALVVFEQRKLLEEEIKARYAAMMNLETTADARESAANEAFAQCVQFRQELEEAGVEFVVKPIEGPASDES